jgi:pyruvate-formate lyase
MAERALKPAVNGATENSARIARLRLRYQTEMPVISIERAKYFTESWFLPENENRPLPIRVALAMLNVYRNVTLHLDPDDRIAGYWTEDFLGVPIPIERGEYNDVLAAELTTATITKFRAIGAAKGVAYLARRRGFREFLQNQRITRAAGTPPLNMSLKTMSEREVNPYTIDPADRDVLLNELLPAWSGKSLADHLETALADAGLFSAEMHDFVTSIPGNTSRQVLWLSTCATVATIQGHLVLDFDRVLRRGLRGMREDVAQRLAEVQDDEQRDFLTSAQLALEGVTVFAQRLAARLEQAAKVEADPARRAELAEMAGICARVPERPVRTFREAVQALWTIKTAVELAHPINLHCFGRLDQSLDPYYRRDVKAGRLVCSEAVELLEELLLKIMSQNIRPESNILGNFYQRFLGSAPVTVGGKRPDGRDGTNEVTYLFVEAACRSKAVTNLSVRVHPGTPDDLLLAVAEGLHGGTSSFSLFNDEVMIPAMQARGFKLRDARDYAIMGCVEATCPGKTGSMSANALQLSRLLDITLRNGDSKILAGTIHGDGLRTGAADGFTDLDALVEAYLRQGRYFIGKIAEGSNMRDRLYAERLPAPLISAFMDGCVESGKDITRGGARYDLTGISMINSIANVVDSLHVIKKLVFERRRLTLSELVTAVEEDFQGREPLLAEIEALPGMWGNGDPETDELAHRVLSGLFAETFRHRSFKDGPFVVYLISMITHTVEGRLSLASPDGRRAATPYAASANPFNVERAGITGVLRSVASLPNRDVLGAAVNVKFHPSALGENRPARQKWINLMRTYFALGGQQIQPTVVDAATLRDAQVQPEKHRDLIVKVGGYSTYFVDLGREIQGEVIARTQHE